VANVPQQSRKGCVLLYDEHADDKWDEFSRRCEREAEFHLGAAPGADSDAGETEAERAVRVARELTVGAPPYREQAKYGPLGDAAGNDLFRADREVWYERFTGRSIAEATLTEQNELCDAIARRFRAYSDGRARR